MMNFFFKQSECPWHYWWDSHNWRDQMGTCWLPSFGVGAGVHMSCQRHQNIRKSKSLICWYVMNAFCKLVRPWNLYFVPQSGLGSLVYIYIQYWSLNVLFIFSKITSAEEHCLYILFWIKWCLMFTGCLLHRVFPVRGFAHPADPRSDPSRSNERNRVLPHPSVGQTGQGTGKKL